MKKIRYLVILALMLPACELAITTPIPNSTPLPSVSNSASANTTPIPQDSSNLNTNNTSSENSLEDNGPKSPSTSPTGIHQDTMPTPDINNPVIPTPQPSPSQAYSINRPIPEGITEGSVELIFKDEFKVRYDREAKVFKSLTGANVSNINNIINSHNIVEVYGTFHKKEEQAEKDERRAEEEGGYDEVNELSSYDLELKDADLKAFIEKLRQDPVVRQSNYNAGIVID